MVPCENYYRTQTKLVVKEEPLHERRKPFVIKC
jgi:hypothetical protein